MVALDGLDKNDLYRFYRDDAKGSYEKALEMLTDSKLAKHSTEPLRHQYAGHPAMVKLVMDPKEQKALIEVMAQLYAYVYTDEELEVIRTFYITDAGQKMLRNAPALGIRAYMMLQDWIEDLMDKAEEMGDDFKVGMPDLDQGDNPEDE